MAGRLARATLNAGLHLRPGVWPSAQKGVEAAFEPARAVKPTGPGVERVRGGGAECVRTQVGTAPSVAKVAKLLLIAVLWFLFLAIGHAVNKSGFERVFIGFY